MSEITIKLSDLPTLDLQPIGWAGAFIGFGLAVAGYLIALAIESRKS